MLKTIRLSNKLALNRNDGNKSASNKNNDSKLAFRKNNGNSEVNRFGVSGNSVEHAKKPGKLSKSRKSKSKKTSKS